MTIRRRDNHSSAWDDTLPSQWDPYPAPPDTVEVDETAAPSSHAKTSVTAPAQAPAPRPTWLPVWRWVAEGLRAAALVAPRIGGAQPTPWQVMMLVLASSAVTVAVARLLVQGPAEFNLRGWLAPQWTTLVLLWGAWWAMTPQRRDALAPWLGLITWVPVPPVAALYGFGAWVTRQPDFWTFPYATWVVWGMYCALMAWFLSALVVLSGRFIRSRWRTAAFTLLAIAVTAVGAWKFSEDEPWQAVASAGAQDGGDPEPPRLRLTQEVFEAQQALWERAVSDLAPQREGVVDVYGLVFAPYAGEEVFRRESTLISNLLQERFDAQGRVLHLLNHAHTSTTHPWATPQNLQRAIAALSERMDRDNDVLVVYMTSHGARNHELAAANWPLEVAPVTPEMLRAALDAAGIRHRVLAISACYSGGWVKPLANDETLVMTAADATHTSYGCGTRSELTFFGRAVFDEQLRQTHSFTEAFAKAVPLIRQREIEAGKSDGFSNPQIHVGVGIEPVLKALEARLANP